MLQDREAERLLPVALLLVARLVPAIEVLLVLVIDATRALRSVTTKTRAADSAALCAIAVRAYTSLSTDTDTRTADTCAARVERLRADAARALGTGSCASTDAARLVGTSTSCRTAKAVRNACRSRLGRSASRAATGHVLGRRRAVIIERAITTRTGSAARAVHAHATWRWRAVLDAVRARRRRLLITHTAHSDATNTNAHADTTHPSHRVRGCVLCGMMARVCVDALAAGVAVERRRARVRHHVRAVVRVCCVRVLLLLRAGWLLACLRLLLLRLRCRLSGLLLLAGAARLLLLACGLLTTLRTVLGARAGCAYESLREIFLAEPATTAERVTALVVIVEALYERIRHDSNEEPEVLTRLAAS